MDPQRPSGDPTVREGYAPGGGASLYYREIGQGHPIIILHGGPSFDHNYLLPDLDRLADAYRLIYYDQRGRGKSMGDVRPEDVSIQSEMDDLERVRDYFELEHTALLGHSWGGLLALEYATRHPERVSHVILLNTAPVSHDDFLLFEQALDANAPDDMKMVRDLESRSAYLEGDVEARAEVYRVYFQATLRSPELFGRLLGSLRVGWTREGFLKARAIGERLWRETAESPEYDLLPKLMRLRIPTLIVHGDYDFVPVICATRIAEAIPGARLVVLRECGHFAYIERPDEVSNAVSEFFRGG